MMVNFCLLACQIHSLMFAGNHTFQALLGKITEFIGHCDTRTMRNDQKFIFVIAVQHARFIRHHNVTVILADWRRLVTSFYWKSVRLKHKFSILYLGIGYYRYVCSLLLDDLVLGLYFIAMATATSIKLYNLQLCVCCSYRTMLQCWDASPVKRPSFSELVEQLGAVLDDNIRRVSSTVGSFSPGVTQKVCPQFCYCLVFMLVLIWYGLCTYSKTS
jgi:hypothetical protein